MAGCLLVKLQSTLRDGFADNGEGHIGIDGAGAVAQKQGGVHHFAYLATLHNKSGLDPLLH